MASEQMHTDGPWMVAEAGLCGSPENRGYRANIASETETVGCAWGHSLDEAMANATLFSAALAMRDALEAMLNDYRSEGCPKPECAVCQRSKHAEAKARGAIALATPSGMNVSPGRR